jgi:hypothetical protein
MPSIIAPKRTTVIGPKLAPFKSTEFVSIEPVKPTEQAKPIESVKPIEQAEQAKPIEPAKPIEQAEQAKPIEPVKPTEQAKPAEQVNTIDQVELLEQQLKKFQKPEEEEDTESMATQPKSAAYMADLQDHIEQLPMTPRGITLE